MRLFEKSIINTPETQKQTAKAKAGNDSDTDTHSNHGNQTNADTVVEVATHQGKIILDATVVEQAIRFPTDLSLLNEAREISERIMDVLYPQTDLTKKPRRYRQKARKAYLAIVKCRRPGKQKYRQETKPAFSFV